MKRKPDAMIAVVALFFVGLIVSGFSSMSVGADDRRIGNESGVTANYERSVALN